MSSDRAPKRVCVGIVTGPHGVRGALRIKSFTGRPADIGAYGPVSDQSGARQLALRVTGALKGVVLAEVEGIDSRDAAERLKGLRLYIERSQLPPAAEEEFYHADLIGLAALLPDGSRLGTVSAVHDFGAGDCLEIRAVDDRIVVVPFTRAAVPVVEPAAGRIIVDPPPGLLEKPAPPAPLDEQESAAAELVGEVPR